MNKRRVVINIFVMLALLGLLVNFEAHRGLHVTYPSIIAGIAACFVVSLLAETIKIGGALYGGWLIYLCALMALYIIQTRAEGPTLAEIISSTLNGIRENGSTLSANAVRLRDVYIVLASASFTLYGLFFVAVKRITLLNAVRLVTISEGFGLVFVFCIPALTLNDAPWWRLALMFLLTFSSLALFAREVKPFVTDFGVDSPTVAKFWMDWMNQRRGYSVLIFGALCVLALWPVFGELVLALTLSYILYSSARSATFLFVSTEIQLDPVNYDHVLRSLFVVNVPRDLEEQVNSAKSHGYRLWFMRSPAKRHVFFRFINQPTSHRVSVPFSFSNSKEKT